MPHSGHPQLKVQSSLQSKAAKPSAKFKVQSPNEGFGRFEKKKKTESKRGQRGAARMESGRKDDWRQFFQGGPIELVGEEPDFSEEGWARRKPKKGKK